jgi:hypothetical protein
MHEVVLRAEVEASAVPGGLAREVTGAGRTDPAIRAIVVPHAAELDRPAERAATTGLMSGGARLTVTAWHAEGREGGGARARELDAGPAIRHILHQ